MELRSGLYKHYTGLLVHVLGVARHSETEDLFVAYIPLGVKAGPNITVRPYEKFFEEVDIKGEKKARFEFVDSTTPQELAKDYLPLSK